ncbi:hypothetical protein O6H91_06G022600 [Diphasiastrum complanatum]|uniref:Uncharacterized protein n=1 Tax=Diphasiastrum complanatum TaxID=34168 RepID=A0ACC2DBD5_DIPCM|nr:hypothetical protein O6H91_06G022600 [Diphasiastrum complanatum]
MTIISVNVSFSIIFNRLLCTDWFLICRIIHVPLAVEILMFLIESIGEVMEPEIQKRKTSGGELSLKVVVVTTGVNSLWAGSPMPAMIWTLSRILILEIRDIDLGNGLEVSRNWARSSI